MCVIACVRADMQATTSLSLKLQLNQVLSLLNLHLDAGQLPGACGKSMIDGTWDLPGLLSRPKKSLTNSI